MLDTPTSCQRFHDFDYRAASCIAFRAGAEDPGAGKVGRDLSLYTFVSLFVF